MDFGLKREEHTQVDQQFVADSYIQVPSEAALLVQYLPAHLEKEVRLLAGLAYFETGSMEMVLGCLNYLDHCIRTRMETAVGQLR